MAAPDVYRVTAHAVADRPAEASAGAYSRLHTQMVRNTTVYQRSGMSPERLGRERVLRAELVSKFCCPAAVTPRMHFHPDSVLPLAELKGAAAPREAEMPVVATCAAG